MIACHSEDLKKYDIKNEKFQIAFDFLQNTDLKALPQGADLKLADGVVAIVKETYETEPREMRKFEMHRNHFDIQYVVEGQEFIGVAPVRGLEQDGPYDEKEDIVFFKEPAFSGGIVLKKKDVAIFSPEDAHKPNCLLDKPEKVRKIVIKIEV